MPHARWLEQALLDAGLDVVVYTGWEERGSPSFVPRGLVIHHTGPWATVEGMVQLCIHGRPDLPGPLCQIVLDPTGVCHLIAGGRANHAGAGGWRGLAGNSSVLGIEAIHAGHTRVPWPQVQLDAFVTVSAALCRAGGFGVDMVCAHREWAPKRKIDPVGIDMKKFRDAVAAQIGEWERPPGTTRFTDYAAGEEAMRRYDLEISLDDGGNGWQMIDVPSEKVLSLVAQGAYPPADGYWNVPVLGRQMRDGRTVVTATEGPPSGKVLVSVWTLS